MRRAALIAMAILLATALLAPWLAPYHYDAQFREAINAPGSGQHLLGTDALGRDRLSRILYATTFSLLLALLAAAGSVAIAGVAGGLAGHLGSRWKASLGAVSDVFVSVPWFFLLITVRATLPLNVDPRLSVVITFLILALLGWATPARAISTRAADIAHSQYILFARSAGIQGPRLFFQHVAPNLQPVLVAQFLLLVPVYILAEANLSVLGLGVAEPLPSWGGLIRELEGLTGFSQAGVVAPAILLVLTAVFLQFSSSREEAI